MARIGSYWDSKGKYQALHDRVAVLIPAEGACPDARGKNRKLEKLRVAVNCYYDLFNNGLCNRAAEFRRVFGFGGSAIVKSRYTETAELESAMDDIIIAAALEQGIALIDTRADEEVVSILRTYQSILGASREQCDEWGKVMWDRIEAAVKGLV